MNNQLIGALDIGTYKTKFLISSLDDKNFIKFKRAVQLYGTRAEVVEVYANSSGQSNWRTDYFIGYSDAAADGNNGDSVKCYTDGAVVSGMPVENNNSLVIGTVYYLNPTVFPAVLTTTVTTY